MIRRWMMTANTAAPPPEVVIGGDPDGQGAALLAGQYVFSTLPSGAAAHLGECYADFQTGSGSVRLVIASDDFTLMARREFDTSQGGPDFDIDISPDWYIGVYVTTTGFIISGDRGFATPGGQTDPVTLGVGNAIANVTFTAGSPAIVGMGRLI